MKILINNDKTVTLVKPDGNCGFRSWSVALTNNRSQGLHKEFRKQACDFKIQNAELFDHLLGTGEALISANNQRQDGAWAELDDMIAMAMLKQKGMIIYTPTATGTLKVIYPADTYEGIFDSYDRVEFIQWSRHWDFIGCLNGDGCRNDIQNLWRNLITQNF